MEFHCAPLELPCATAMILIISSFLHTFLELERIKEVIQFNQPLNAGSHPSHPGEIPKSHRPFLLPEMLVPFVREF